MFRVSLVALNAAGVSGVPRYTATLARAIDAVGHEFPDLELALVTTAGGAKAVGARAMKVDVVDGVASRVLRRAGRVVNEQLALPARATDLFHFFDIGAPLLPPRRPFVVTFHDASIRYADTSHFSRLQRAYKLRLYPWSLPRARAVIAVSDFAKDEAIRQFDVEAERIHVVRSGPGLTLIAQAGAAERRRDAPYLLFVGNLTASKNVPFLIRAYDRADVAADLVLAGRPVEDLPAIEEMIRSSRSRRRIQLVTMPTDAELDRLYRGALALAFPTRYEGFGFPPLEAMARGCAVLASDVPAVREISGLGAELIPLSEDAWVAGIRRVVSDETFREELVERGRRGVAQYTWEKTARGVCGVLAGVAFGQES